MTDSQSRNPGKKEPTQTGDTADQAQPVAQQVQEKAGQVAQQAQQQATSVAETQKTKASQSLDQVSRALQQAGRQLEQQGQSMPGQVMTKGAQRVDRLSAYLDSHTVQEMVGEVEDLARRQPALFLGGSLAAGFLLSRFLKSSPPSNESAASGGSAMP